MNVSRIEEGREVNHFVNRIRCARPNSEKRERNSFSLYIN